MRIIFAGTPDFAARVLEAVVQAGHDVALVLCQPDRPAGRGQKLVAPPVKRRALELGLKVGQPPKLKDEEATRPLREAQADLMLVVAYGLLLPATVLQIPRLGCINVHASLLPRWRGAAPIQRAIESGDRQTGITIMQMDEGLDTGPMLLAEPLAIGPEESGGSLHDRLAELGARMALEALEGLERGVLSPRAQPGEGITYARKIERADAQLDWTETAQNLADRIRAFDPSPGCVAALEHEPDQLIKIWRARIAELPGDSADAAPGTVMESPAGTLWVACGAGVLEVLEVQRAGGRRQSSGEFLRGRPLAAGLRFAVTRRGQAP